MSRKTLVKEATTMFKNILIVMMLYTCITAALAESDKPFDNLLVNGDFEKGGDLPEGWKFIGRKGNLPPDRLGEFFEYGQTKAPVGNRSLCLKENDGMAGIRQNVTAEPSSEYEYKLSGYFKTEKYSGKLLRLAVIDRGWTKWYAFIDVKKDNQDWMLVEKTFKMPETGKGFAVVCYAENFTGKVWVDGIKLEVVRKLAGDELPAEYVEAKKQEQKKAAAAVTAKDISVKRFYPLGASGIFVEGESILLRLQGVNDLPEKAELTVNLSGKDFYGAPTIKKSFTFTAEGKAAFVHDINLGPAQSKNGFTIITGNLTQGSTILENLSTTFCIIKPVTERDPFFFLNGMGAGDKFTIKGTKMIGFAGRQIGFSFGFVPEPLRGKWSNYISNELRPPVDRNTSFWESDMLLTAALNTTSLVTVPVWHKKEVEARKKEGKFPYPDEFFQEFGDFVEALAIAVQGRINAWDLVEEIDAVYSIAQDFKKGEYEIERYNRMVKIAYERIKKINPGAEVRAIGVSLDSELCTTPRFSLTRTKLLPVIKDYFDIIGPDMYNGPFVMNESNYRSISPELWKFRECLLDTVALQASLPGKKREIAILEKGVSFPYHVALDHPMARRFAAITARNLIIARSVHELKTYNFFYGAGGAAYSIFTKKLASTDDNPIEDFGLWKGMLDYLGPEGWYFQPRSAVAAFATTTRHLAFASEPVEINLRNGFYCYAFQKKLGAVAALWTIEENPYPAILDVPVNAEICDLMGNTRPLKAGRNEIIVNEFPQFITIPGTVRDMSDVIMKTEFPTLSLLKVESHLSDLNTLSVYLFNKTTRQFSAKVELEPFTAITAPVTSKTVVVGDGITQVDFTLQGATAEKLANEKASVKVSVGDRVVTASDSLAVIPVARIKSPLVIDGDISKYEKMKPIVLESSDKLGPGGDVQVKGLWTDKNDLSARMYVAWDDNNFYFAGTVTDDVFLQRNTGASIWKGDSIQLAFDTMNDALAPDESVKAGFNGNDHQFGIALTTNGNECYCWLANGVEIKKGEGGRKFPLAIRKGNGAITYELAIPWKELAPLLPKAGNTFRFNFIVWDNDREDEREASYWMGLTPGIAGGQDPSAYRVFVLE